jgi:hypothetical protein
MIELVAIAKIRWSPWQLAVPHALEVQEFAWDSTEFLR